MRIVLVALVACSAPPDPPADFAPLRTWAHDAGIKLSPPHGCDDIETLQFGAERATCWYAKSLHEQTPGSRMFPRFDITLADYGSDRAARARMRICTACPPATPS